MWIEETYTGSGGGVAAGSADAAAERLIAALGGGLVAGAATLVVERARTGSGGGTAAGVATLVAERAALGAGGGTAAGHADFGPDWDRAPAAGAAEGDAISSPTLRVVNPISSGYSRRWHWPH